MPLLHVNPLTSSERCSSAISASASSSPAAAETYTILTYTITITITITVTITMLYYTILYYTLLYYNLPDPEVLQRPKLREGVVHFLKGHLALALLYIMIYHSMILYVYMCVWMCVCV